MEIKAARQAGLESAGTGFGWPGDVRSGIRFATGVEQPCGCWEEAPFYTKRAEGGMVQCRSHKHWIFISPPAFSDSLRVLHTEAMNLLPGDALMQVNDVVTEENSFSVAYHTDFFHRENPACKLAFASC